jgi:hypothetical protein
MVSATPMREAVRPLCRKWSSAKSGHTVKNAFLFPLYQKRIILADTSAIALLR